MLIDTPAGWWAVFQSRKADLRRLVENFHPSHINEELASEFPVSAPAVESIREKCLAPNDLPLLPVMEFDEATRTRDYATLVRLLNATWFGIPESSEAQTLPGFRDLCDLCSESWVFDETEGGNSAG
jgi:hypothetical protein